MKVFLVEYCYDYEGCSAQALYKTRKLAETHPRGGDDTEITEMKVETKPYKEPRAEKAKS